MKYLNWYLFGTVFITGACVLVLEIAAIRVLSPFFGSSLNVVSSVLTVILAALSVGYWVGGKWSDDGPTLRALYGVITLSGVITLLVLLCIQMLLSDVAILTSQFVGPLVFSFLLFFVPAFLLGIVSPYIIKLQSLNTDSDHIGAVVGKTFFWGTVGSISGSLMVGFVLIPTFGVALTILGVGVTLIALGLITPFGLGEKPHPHLLFGTVVATIILIGIYINNQSDGDYVYRTEGVYSSIVVEDETLFGKPIRTLHRDTNNSSAIFLDSKELVFGYTQFGELYPTLKPDTESVLILGGGAYATPRTLAYKNPDLKIDVVEIEPALFPIAQEYFDLPDTDQITNYVMDARYYLDRTDTSYDLIFSDTFGTDLAAPFHLTTVEFYALAKSRLNEDGIFILNTIGKPSASEPSLIGSVAETIKRVFPNVHAYALGTSEEEMQNVVFVARNGETPITFTDERVLMQNLLGKRLVNAELDLDRYNQTSEILLTDDHAPVGYLMAKQRAE